jgi:hypothetical protein
MKHVKQIVADDGGIDRTQRLLSHTTNELMMKQMTVENRETKSITETCCLVRDRRILRSTMEKPEIQHVGLEAN